MRRKALSLTLILAFLMLAGTQLAKEGKANPFFETRLTSPPVVTIHSPVNETCVNNVLLSFTVEKPEVWIGNPGRDGYAQTFDGVYYDVDGKFYGLVGVEDRSLASPLNYQVYLTNLTDGAHTLTVRAYATGYVIEVHGLWDYYVPINSSSEIHFTLDATSPVVSVLSLENKVYYTSDVPLNFMVNEVASQASYSLDGQENMTLAGNITLTNLPYGAHNVTVYATDNAGNTGVSETIYFSVEKETESFPTTMLIAPFPTTLVIASIASVAIAVVGLLFYFKNRKR